jgi:hypothetical protein
VGELTGMPLTAHCLGGCPIGDSPEAGPGRASATRVRAGAVFASRITRALDPMRVGLRWREPPVIEGRS